MPEAVTIPSTSTVSTSACDDELQVAAGLREKADGWIPAIPNAGGGSRHMPRDKATNGLWGVAEGVNQQRLYIQGHALGKAICISYHALMHLVGTLWG